MTARDYSEVFLVVLMCYYDILEVFLSIFDSRLSNESSCSQRSDDVSHFYVTYTVNLLSITENTLFYTLF